MTSIRKLSLTATLVALVSLPVLARAEATLEETKQAIGKTTMAEASIGGQKFTYTPVTKKK